MLTNLRKSAEAINKPEWGNSGPSNAGGYRDLPHNIQFFKNNEHDNWNSPYGKFFLKWYSDQLIKHGEDILSSAKSIFNGTSVQLAAKIAGIHWWYNTHSHSAELTAGYYNTIHYNGYRDIARMFQNIILNSNLHV